MALLVLSNNGTDKNLAHCTKKSSAFAVLCSAYIVRITFVVMTLPTSLLTDWSCCTAYIQRVAVYTTHNCGKDVNYTDNHKRTRSTHVEYTEQL